MTTIVVAAFDVVVPPPATVAPPSSPLPRLAVRFHEIRENAPERGSPERRHRLRFAGVDRTDGIAYALLGNDGIVHACVG